MLQGGRSRFPFLMRPLDFSNFPNTSCRTINLGVCQPLTEISTRNFPDNEVGSADEVHVIAAVCGPIVHSMSEPSYRPPGSFRAIASNLHSLF
jgi:hypothetical protein